MSTELIKALHDAATSLETISRLAGKSHYVGDAGQRIETYMEHHDQVRGYAASRAACAREALAALVAVSVEPVAVGWMRKSGLARLPRLPSGYAEAIWPSKTNFIENGEPADVPLYAHPAPQHQQTSRLSGLHISKEWLTAKLAEGDDSNCQVGQPQQSGVAPSAKKTQTPLEIVAELLVMAKTQGRRKELNACIEKALDMTRILVAQEQTTPSRQPPAPALNEAEFLSKRLARVAELAGVPMPDMSHEGIAEVAGTILGSIARSLEGRTLHGQRLHFTPDGVQSEPTTLELPPASPKGQP